MISNGRVGIVPDCAGGVIALPRSFVIDTKRNVIVGRGSPVALSRRINIYPPAGVATWFLFASGARAPAA